VTHRLLFGGIVSFAVMLSAPGCQKPTEAPKPPPPEVTVSRPVEREITDYFEFPGQTAAVEEVEVRARVTGYLVKVCFDDGQEVKRGDLLYEIDARPYQAALDRARGAMASVQALCEKAKIDLARSKRLRPSGAVSLDEYEQRKSMLEVHQASIQSAEAAVRDAELNVEFTKITSPIDGRVSRTRVTKGNLIQLSTNDSAVLTTVVTVHPIYVYFDIDQQALLRYEELARRTKQDLHLSRLKKQKVPIEIGLGDEEGFPHAGVFDFADNKVDRTTGTLRARGVFPNENAYLVPGQYVRVRVPVGRPHEALLVPDLAIGREQGQKFLLVANAKNKVEYRKVKLGALNGDLRVIESGVGRDDWVIVSGLQFAVPGEPVRAKRQEASVKK
jgi:membrane fusion protein, multidrug efflux system